MVKIKPISDDKLEEVIRIAFEGDEAIYEYYDPNVSVVSLEEIVRDVSRKIKAVQGTDFLQNWGIFEEEKLIGYSVMGENFLFSFGINIRYRKGDILQEWWKQIKELMKQDFAVLLYSRNSRAIQYLLKNGCEIEREEDGITYLISYEQCQQEVQ